MVGLIKKLSSTLKRVLSSSALVKTINNGLRNRDVHRHPYYIIAPATYCITQYTHTHTICVSNQLSGAVVINRIIINNYINKY